jgi:hypothetical protein
VIVLRHVGSIVILFQSVIVIVIRSIDMRYIIEKTRTTNKYLSTKQKIYRYVCLVFVYCM